MQAYSTPSFLQDAQQLLNRDGFARQGKWYHGTSSGLIDSIAKFGLRGSGDVETAKNHFDTLGTLGHEANTAKVPLFLTQSKELAYFWARQKTHTRNRYKDANEEAIVYEISLPEELQQQIITDAGGAAFILEPGNRYIEWLKEIYALNQLEFPELNPFQCDREDYLNKLGLAYTDLDIDAQYLQLLKEAN